MMNVHSFIQFIQGPVNVYINNVMYFLLKQDAGRGHTTARKCTVLCACELM